ncbi:MAG: amidohydrolase family protein, partial [Actinomycetota bacterium]|nr:amidohydrolase family protein [Actinomycetota bacterium]
GADTVIDARGCLLMPGFVQAHVHLCQTLFRGLADDMDVIDWLRERVWPLEQAHDADSLHASAALGVAELLLSGTTSVLSMETTRHTDSSFEAARELGIRAIIGPALMDRWEPGTEMVGQTTDEAMAEVRRLVDRWHGTEGGRLRVSVSPRGPRNATPSLWRECVALAEAADLRIHTHVNENRKQAARLSRGADGRDVYALDSYGALSHRLVMAHCVWLDGGEKMLVRARGAHVCHCPSANMKLASGLAPVPEYLGAGINVALGSDGAACNNNLDAFEELRLAALIHRPRYGPSAVPAARALEMATRGGAKALGIDREVGSLELGKRADVVVLRRDGVHAAPISGAPLESQIVFAHTSADVKNVVVDGRVVVDEGQLVSGDAGAIRRDAENHRRSIMERAGLVIGV